MSISKSILITIALLATISHVIPEEPPKRGTKASIRKFIGPRPLVHTLWNNLKGTKVPLWRVREFHEQEFCYLGRTNEESYFQLVNFTTIWGQSSHATKRLLIFDSKNQFFGMYSQLDAQVQKLDGSILIFKSGRADFKNGPPSTIENSTFESAQSILKGY